MNPILPPKLAFLTQGVVISPHMSRILILESDKDIREIFEDSLAEGKIKDATVISSVSEAIKALKEGGVEVFRTNYINDDLPLEECFLYSADAIREALTRGIKVEVGTVSTRIEVEGSFKNHDLGNFFKDVIVVPKWKDMGELSVPGESESPTKNERL